MTDGAPLSDPAQPTPPRVFISYAQFDQSHSTRVLQLASELAADGIDVELDQFHGQAIVDWPRWCAERLDPAHTDFVLMVCTAEYKRRIENKVAWDKGRGVFWEGNLIYGYLYRDKANERFVPVLLDDEPADSLPAVVANWTNFRLRGLGVDSGDAGYEALYRLLTSQPATPKPEPGTLKRLPPRPIPPPRPDTDPATADAQPVEPTNPSRPDPRQPAGRVLTVRFELRGGRLQRRFSAGGQPLQSPPPTIPASQLTTLLGYAQAPPPDDTARRRQLGAALYRLLFDEPRAGLFGRIADQAWEQPESTQPNGLGAELRIECSADDEAACRAVLGLPWHLTGFAGEGLAEQIGWRFEAEPVPGGNGIQPLSPEPPLLLWVDRGLEGAATHADVLGHLVERTRGFDADDQVCDAQTAIAEQARQTPTPELLYVHTRAADLDLDALAVDLGGSCPLVVLNLIGDTLPAPPPALVQGRKVALAVHGAAAADRAREAGAKWLQAMLGEAGAADWRGTLLQAFGPGLRLWSGCEGLETRIARARGSLFRRPLIKLLLDRVTARRDVSDAAANALLQGRGTLALVAAGTAEDHPELLPRQVWHHYEHMREARSRDLIHRRHLTLDPGLPPELDELRYRLASRLGCDVDGLDDAFDALAGDTLADERLILSLEWHVPPPEAPADAGRWRQDWLAGWLDLGTGVLAAYRRTGVLLVNMLIVRADDPAAAAAWTAAAQALYRKRRGQLGADARRGFVYHHLEPLSVVPVEDIEHFLDLHYRLGEHHPRLDPLDVAEWVHGETGGVFARTVDLMEQLHDSSFQRAYDALATAP